MLPKRSAPALLLALVLLILPACGEDGGETDSSQAEEQASRVETAAGEKSLLQLLSDGQPPASNVIVLDTSLWGGVGGEFETLLSVNAPELVSMMEDALDALHPVSGERLADPPEPSGELLFLEVSGGSGESDYWLDQLAVLPDGTVYHARGVWADIVFHRYALAEPDGYERLRTAVRDTEARRQEEIAYILEAYASPAWFQPQSEVLRLYVQNTGDKPVTFSTPFTLEYETADGWTALDYVGEETPQTLTVEPGEGLRQIVWLDDYRGSREPQGYRAGNTFFYGEQSMEYLIPYVVDPDAHDTSNPPSPEMTPEHQGYYDRYLSAWGFYSLFMHDFSPDNPPTEFNAYLLYHSSAWQEGVAEEYDARYGADVPAEVVEGTIARHYPITPEAVRASLPQSGEGERYDPATNTYYFPGGYGGGASSGVVTSASLDGNLLTLECDWYGMDDTLSYSHRVTILLGEGDADFLYQTNVVTGLGSFG